METAFATHLFFLKTFGFQPSYKSKFWQFFWYFVAVFFIFLPALLVVELLIVLIFKSEEYNDPRSAMSNLSAFIFNVDHITKIVAFWIQRKKFFRLMGNIEKGFKRFKFSEQSRLFLYLHRFIHPSSIFKGD